MRAISAGHVAAVLLVAVLQTGCDMAPSEPRPAVAASDSAAEPAVPEGSTTPGLFEEKNDLFDFRYSWPADAARIPALATRFGSEAQADRDQLETQASDGKEAAEEGGYPYRQYTFWKEWDVVAGLPRFLSLSAQIYTFTGGAHGMTVFDALVWDREARAALEPLAMFASAEALDGAVKGSFCARLDQVRAGKRGTMPKWSDSPFDSCIAPVANSTVILGSAKGQAFDRIGFLIPPYNAGPYAEGTYELTLPVTANVIEAVKPEYRDAFAVGG